MAAALPTPGLMAHHHRATQHDMAKSAGHANIDLARIYISMGDPATAHRVLQQVMQEGAEDEKALALHMLQEMA